MNAWFDSNYAARVISNEKVLEAGREHMVIVDRTQVKALVSLFRNMMSTFL